MLKVIGKASFVFRAGLLFTCLLCSSLIAEEAKETVKKSKEARSVLSFKLKSLDGKDVELSKYQGKVLLIVNVASECGLTPQYDQLQALHEQYADKGLAVLGFPCNQFGAQEPGSAAEIQQFCQKNYGVKFDMFEKIDVNGEEAAKLYKYLTAQETKPKGAGKVGWNFEKFVIDSDGKVQARFDSNTSPDAPEVVEVLEKLLKK
jgi:glutathione peroxidase